MRIAIQANFSMGYSRQILSGFLAFRETQRHWVLHVNALGSWVPARSRLQVDAVCVIGGAMYEGVLPDAVKKRVYIGGSVIRPEAVTIDADNYRVGELAAEYYHRAGFANMAVFNASRTIYGRMRRRGFRERATALGARVYDMLPRREGAENRHAIRRLGQWISSLPKPVGIFVVTDTQAVVVATACTEAGAEIPHEVAVMGVDNDELICELGTVALSSVDHGTYRMGWLAGQVLARWEAGESGLAGQRLQVPPMGIVERASTSILAHVEPSMNRALSFIRREACRGISVDEVARQAGTNRRTLERRFSQQLGRSILQEIQFCRMDTARQLLSTTSMPLGEIAEHCGFKSSSEFSHAFRRQTGSTPSAYRAGFTQVAKTL